MVKEEPHGNRLRRQGITQAARRVLQHLLYVLAGHAWKPLKELVYRGATLQIRKQRRNRYPRSSKNPSATDSFGVALYGRACRPVKHKNSYLLSQSLNQSASRWHDRCQSPGYLAV